MRGIGAKGVKGVVGVGLAVALVVGAIGGWIFFLSTGDSKDPIVVGTSRTPTSADPGAAYDAGSSDLFSNVYQSLLTYVPGQEAPVPDAAESCDYTDNELTVYRCTVRDDLQFSSGRAVEAEDAQFSFQRIMDMAARAAEEAENDDIPDDEKFSYSGPSGLLTTLEEVRVDGQDVIFELSGSDATFPFIVASAAGSIVDRESYEKLEPRTDNKAVGSGPYLLTRFNADEYAELEPNPDYRGAIQDLPEYPITMRYFIEQEDGPGADKLLEEAWEKGEIEVNDGKMPPDYLAEINPSNPDFRVSESTGSSIRVLAFNTDEGRPMVEMAARQAAAAMIDREAISRRIQAQTVESLYSLIPVGFTGHSTPFYDQYVSPDPDELRGAMEAAGLEIPVKFDIAYSRGAANHEEADLIKQQLESEGLFDVTVEYYDWSEFIPGIYNDRAYDAYLVGWRPDFPDPATFTDNVLGLGDGMGTGHTDPAILDLISVTSAEPDRGRAVEDFHRIHELAAEQAAIIPIWQEKRYALSVNEITGIQNLTDNSQVLRLWELRRI